MTNDSRIKDIVYKRRNGENLIGDPQAIASCKNEQSRDVIDNARLGSYDKFGNYVIIPDIKREIISMPKLVYNVKNLDSKTVYELKGSIPMFGDLYFKLSFAGEEAVLTITETVHREANGYLEVYDEVVDSMAYGKNSLPQDVIFRNYNIVEKPDDFGKQSGLYDFNNILTRKVYLSLLSKELKEVSKFDERQAFDKMVSTLKNGGEYGARVLKEFVLRLKERPGVFEISQSENYNKAVNEVLLSSLDIATTQEDKEEYSTRQVYLDVLNARNENIEDYLAEANSRVDEKYVKNVVDKATQSFEEENAQEETVEEFFDRIAGKKSVPTKRKLEKAVLKQGKGEEEENEEEQSKEDKIKSILDKKSKDKDKSKDKSKDKAKEKGESQGKAKAKKKTPAGKKLKPSKSKQKTNKLKGKGKGKKKSAVKKKGSPSKKKSAIKRKFAKKKLGKGKLKGKGKNKKKKFKKAKSLQRAKAKFGGKIGSKPPEAKKPAVKKKANKKPVMTDDKNIISVAELTRYAKQDASSVVGRVVASTHKASVPGIVVSNLPVVETPLHKLVKETTQENKIVPKVEDRDAGGNNYTLDKRGASVETHQAVLDTYRLQVGGVDQTSPSGILNQNDSGILNQNSGSALNQNSGVLNTSGTNPQPSNGPQLNNPSSAAASPDATVEYLNIGPTPTDFTK